MNCEVKSVSCKLRTTAATTNVKKLIRLTYGFTGGAACYRCKTAKITWNRPEILLSGTVNNFRLLASIHISSNFCHPISKTSPALIRGTSNGLMRSTPDL